jgi:hypothetical protein
MYRYIPLPKDKEKDSSSSLQPPAKRQKLDASVTLVQEDKNEIVTTGDSTYSVDSVKRLTFPLVLTTDYINKYIIIDDKSAASKNFMQTMYT